MKMYKKSELVLVDGMLVKEDTGDIVTPDLLVVSQANKLETILQQAKYLAAQPSATPMPSLDGFKRESINDDVMEDAKFVATTPLLDMQAAKTIKMMEELDDFETVDKANKMLAEFSELLAFVDNDYVIDTGASGVFKFDTPTLGDILLMRRKDITNAIAHIAGLRGDDDCADCDEDDCALHPDNGKVEEYGYVKISSKEDLENLFEKLSAVFDDTSDLCSDIENGNTQE